MARQDLGDGDGRSGVRGSETWTLAGPVNRPRWSAAARRWTLLAGLAMFAVGCATGAYATERFPVSDLLRGPNAFVGAREILPGTRQEQLQELACTVREAVGEDWTAAGTSLVVDGESLIARADAAVLARIRGVLAEMRRFR